MIEAVQALRGWRDETGVSAGAQVPAKVLATGYEETAEHLARLAHLTLANGDGGGRHGGVGGRPRRHHRDPGLRRSSTSGRPSASASSAAPSSTQRSSAPQRKLANQGFVAKAPPAVVQEERDKLARLQAELETL